MTQESPFDAHRENVNRPLIRLFSEYGRPEARWFFAGVLANIVGRVVSLVPPLVLGAAIDGIFPEDATFRPPLIPEPWIPAGRVGQLWLAFAVVVAAFVVGAVFTWIWGVTSNVFAHRVQHAVRTDTFEKMQTLDMSFFDDKQTGEIMSVLNNDVTNLETFLDNALSNSVRMVLMVTTIAAVLVYLNAQLAAVTLVAVPLLLVFTWGFMRLIEPRYRRVRSTVGKLNTRLENSLSGVRLVKTSATEDYETDRLEKSSLDYYKANMSVLRISYFYRPGMELLAGASFAATFLVGGYWVVAGPPPYMSGTLTVGEFVVFIVMIRRFVEPLASVSDTVDQYENAKASAERVFGLMDISSGVQDAPDAVELDDVEGHVEYDGVSFSYAGDDECVLENVSLNVQSGETVALVGPTGAGKSTVVKLLTRMYDVDEGTVRLDGHDVRDVTKESLRRAVGYVSQDPFLFDGTVGDNIRYGAFDTSEEEVREAARAAEAHGFIENLPHGYETRVGERGVKLSGGQRQRLAIARAIVRDPAILILDEATSDVDTETEMLIQRSLDDLTKDRTTFVVAHRLSTVKDADEIIVLEDGRVVENGTHEKLIARGGLYADLWRIQVGDAESR